MTEFHRNVRMIKDVSHASAEFAGMNFGFYFDQQPPMVQNRQQLAGLKFQAMMETPGLDIREPAEK